MLMVSRLYMLAGLPGKLEVGVGYFPKAHIIDEQLKKTDRGFGNSLECVREERSRICQSQTREAKKDEQRNRQLKLQQYRS